jgi:hypothetical protein
MAEAEQHAAGIVTAAAETNGPAGPGNAGTGSERFLQSPDAIMIDVADDNDGSWHEAVRSFSPRFPEVTPAGLAEPGRLGFHFGD